MTGGAGMRLWHQSMTELRELDRYRTTMEQHARAVLGPDTEVVVRGLFPGSYGGLAPSDVLGYPYAYHLILGQTVEAAHQAEQAGFDAFVIGSYSEPFLREIRSLVDIPVASMAESTFLVACSLGRLQALIANGPVVARMVTGQVDKHGLRSRVQGVYALDPPLHEADLVAAWDAPEEVVSTFTLIATAAVEAGADVVVPAEGVLSELLHSAGLTSVAGAPVVDSLAVTWHYAEMLVGLWRRTGLRVGRRWEYPRPGPEVLASVRALAGLDQLPEPHPTNPGATRAPAPDPGGRHQHGG